MGRTRVAIIGQGKLGRACAEALRDSPGLELAGIVRDGEHIRELPAVNVALVCVPRELTLAVAAELLEQRFDVVECGHRYGLALTSARSSSSRPR